jgi:hypothetical protein
MGKLLTCHALCRQQRIIAVSIDREDIAFDWSLQDGEQSLISSGQKGRPSCPTRKIARSMMPYFFGSSPDGPRAEEPNPCSWLVFCCHPLSSGCAGSSLRGRRKTSERREHLNDHDWCVALHLWICFQSDQRRIKKYRCVIST